MCRNIVDIHSATAEIRRGKKKKIEDRKKPQGKNIMSASATQGDHKQEHALILYQDTYKAQDKLSDPA